MDDTRGYVWPVVLVFVVAGAAAIFSLVMIARAGQPPLEAISLAAVVVALLAGYILYRPRLLVAANLANIDTISGHVAEIRTTLRGAQGTGDQIAALAGAIAGVNAQLAIIEQRLNEARQSSNIATGLAASVGSLRTELGTLNARLRDVEARLPTIG